MTPDRQRTCDPVDPGNEASVLTLLERAGQWLSTAVARSEPIETVVAMKAQVATAAEATKQLGLSKEIQLDAQEMVRRAEYAVGKSIRKGQAEGTVARDHGGDRRSSAASELERPTTYAGKRELYGSDENRPGIYALADAAEPDFEAALDEAKAEGNLSRANVARKASKKTEAKPRRGPLTKSVWNAVMAAETKLTTLRNLTRDDRWPRNANEVAPRLRNDLARLNDLLEQVAQALPNSQETTND